MMQKLRFLLLILVIGCSPSPGDELAGYYEGTLENNGQFFTMGMEFSMDSSQITAHVLFPEYGWSFGLGNAELKDSLVVVGSLNLTYDSDNSSISGVLPNSFVPSYQIPFELKKTETRSPFNENTFIQSSRQPDVKIEIGEKIWSGLSSNEEQLYVGTLEGNYHLIDTDSKSKVWTYECGSEIRGPSLIKDEFSYVYSDNGLLHKINNKGKAVWTFDSQLDSIERVISNYDHYTARPAHQDGKVYFGNGDGILFTLSDNDGSEINTYQANGPIRSTPLFDSGNLIYASFDGTLESMKIDSDFKNYTIDHGITIAGGPTLFNDLLIFGDRRYDLTAIDKNTGEVRWKYYYWMSWIESTPVAFEDNIYVGSSDSQMLNALNANSGELIWNFDTGGCPWSSPLVTEEYVFTATVGTLDYAVKHYGYLVCLDRRTGEEMWRFSPEPESEGHYGFAGSPILFDGKVWIGSTDGNVYGFNIEEL